LRRGDCFGLRRTVRYVRYVQYELFLKSNLYYVTVNEQVGAAYGVEDFGREAIV
jgi:hypothetical protein